VVCATTVRAASSTGGIFGFTGVSPIAHSVFAASARTSCADDVKTFQKIVHFRRNQSKNPTFFRSMKRITQRIIAVAMALGLVAGVCLHFHMDFLAKRDDEHVVIVVRRRNDLSENTKALADALDKHTNWILDLVVLPASVFVTAPNSVTSSVPTALQST
jgi:hypothetical protein